MLVQGLGISQRTSSLLNVVRFHFSTAYSADVTNRTFTRSLYNYLADTERLSIGLRKAIVQVFGFMPLINRPVSTYKLLIKSVCRHNDQISVRQSEHILSTVRFYQTKNMSKLVFLRSRLH